MATREPAWNAARPLGRAAQCMQDLLLEEIELLIMACGWAHAALISSAPALPQRAGIDGRDMDAVLPGIFAVPFDLAVQLGPIEGYAELHPEAAAKCASSPSGVSTMFAPWHGP